KPDRWPETFRPALHPKALPQSVSYSYLQAPQYWAFPDGRPWSEKAFLRPAWCLSRSCLASFQRIIAAAASPAKLHGIPGKLLEACRPEPRRKGAAGGPDT